MDPQELLRMPVDRYRLLLLRFFDDMLLRSRKDLMLVDETDGTPVCTEREFTQLLREKVIEHIP